jgi:two-component system phosphate regulon sensor histidine kinase PhoR
VRLNLFWKLGLTFLALLLGVLLAVDFYAERALRHGYERGFDQLAAIARIALARPPQIPSPPPTSVSGLAGLIVWTREIAASGARVTVIAPSGLVLTDSQADPATMENHANRPEIRAAFERGSGQSVRYSRTLGHDLLYYAVREDLPSGSAVVLRFALPVAQMDEEMRQFRRRLWFGSLIILLLASGTSLAVWRGFSGRVERLKLFSRRVAVGNFRPLEGERGSDALGDLALSLNETAAQLEQTIRTLTEERNLSAAILASMVEGVAVINAAERLVFANRAFAEILEVGVTPKAGSALVEVARQTDLIAAVRRVLAGETTVGGEIATGTVRQRFFAATVSAVEAGAGRGAVIVLHDITDLRRLERVRRDFVANVSHEFKTPLTAIQGFAETLLGGALEDEKNRRRFLEILLEHARRLARLTDDLLELSQIEAERFELEIRPFPVNELLESCMETTRLRAAEKRLALSVECLPGLPAVAGDRRRLGVVLQNLLDNAVQYTPSGGRIKVLARREGSEVLLTVSDTGIGIPKAEQARIFERFYRVDSARSREAGGTGLGLAIAKHIVEAHGGRIWVESELGQGSSFHFSVLVLDAERPAAVSTKSGKLNEEHL